jgi:hypothetical protein
VFRIQFDCLNVDKSAEKYKHKFDHFPLTCSLYSFIAWIWTSWPEVINIKLIVSLPHIPYTVYYLNMATLAGTFCKTHYISEKYKLLLWLTVYFFAVYKATCFDSKIMYFILDDGYPFIAETCSLVPDEYMLCWLPGTFIVFQTLSIPVLIAEFNNYFNLF